MTSFTRVLRRSTDNTNVTNKNKYKMSNPNFSNETFFQIYYCSKNKMYDFTIFDSTTKEVIYHYHFSNLKQINKLIQNYK